MQQLTMHEAIKPLAWLKGIWRTRENCPGTGKFPTITPFKYHEEINWSSIGQPMLNYAAKSWDVETKKPLHYEMGFLKIIPDTNKVHLLLSHNFGATTIEEGIFENKIIKLRSTNIGRPTKGTNLHKVTEIQREFKLIGDCLQHTLYMATEKTPELHEHVCAVYIRKCDDA
ncbi:THAP domain-containing protein 4-like [Apis dorsata]|uniref:THAP domain-containing protein 4-like n=1 Tax=Apis dorsata TaxID=7462 RepID=UPI0012939C0F|nr:THAP domain-containing protein 4-like [Apis dorsata]